MSLQDKKVCVKLEYLSPDSSEEKVSPEGMTLPDEAVDTHFSVN